jgi:hypothetical protein
MTVRNVNNKYQKGGAKGKRGFKLSKAKGKPGGLTKKDKDLLDKYMEKRVNRQVREGGKQYNPNYKSDISNMNEMWKRKSNPYKNVWDKKKPESNINWEIKGNLKDKKGKHMQAGGPVYNAKGTRVPGMMQDGGQNQTNDDINKFTFDRTTDAIEKDKPNWNEKLNRLTKKRTKRKEKGKDTSRVQKRINKEYYKINPKDQVAETTPRAQKGFEYGKKYVDPASFDGPGDYAKNTGMWAGNQIGNAARGAARGLKSMFNFKHGGAKGPHGIL